MSHHLLVMGAGSVGKRHMRNLVELGCRISAMDPREDRLAEVEAELPLSGRYVSLREAQSAFDRVDAVVIGSPTAYHVEQAIAALQCNLPVFLEKPVGMSLDEALRLKASVERTKGRLLLGYTYRWWPPIRDLHRRVLSGEIGRVLHVRGLMSAHLADWHPWEAYQSFFMAHAELGGGALLDESHLVDLVYNFFGVPNRVFASVERISPLEIETDDNVDVWMCYEEGPRVWLHLDLYGRPHRREMTIVGEEGTLHWTMDPNRVRFGNATADEWQDAEYSCSRNDMFMAAVQEFLDIVDRRTEPSCTIRDGVQVMRILEAMRSSSRSGSVVVLDQ